MAADPVSRVKVFLSRLRTPEAFLALAVCAALISVISLKAGFFAGLAFIFLCFRPKAAFVIALIYAAAMFAASHSAFVLDVQYSGSKRTLITTKGRLKGVSGDIATGDLLWGNFKYSVERMRNGIPRQIAEPTGNYSLYRVFMVSGILSARQQQSAALFNRSGGKVHTTQAHIYAIRGYIPGKEKDEYIITGLAHLLAMSGFHVGIFTGGLFLLFSFLPRKTRVIPIVLLLPLLIPLSGFAVTVLRAVFFAMAALIGWFADLKVMSLRFLALLAGFVLLFSPFSLFSISFLLSFFAVFGIIILFQKRYSFVKGIIIVGVASSVFIMPFQLYFFGTANMASVITTVIMTPVVWAQMLFGLAASVLPSVMIAPLAVIEQFAAWLMDAMYKLTWPFMYVSKQSASLLAPAFVIAMMLSFTRFRLASLAMLALPLLPIYPKHEIYFPKLPPSTKGYVLVDGKQSEIFYQGMLSTFVYDMVPAAARFGIKTFDHGSIRIFDGENLYLKIRDTTTTGLVCVNNLNGGCPYSYSTRSNTLKAPLPEATKAFIIYNNKPVDPRILIQSELDGGLVIDLSEGTIDVDKSEPGDI